MEAFVKNMPTLATISRSWKSWGAALDGKLRCVSCRDDDDDDDVTEIAYLLED